MTKKDRLYKARQEVREFLEGREPVELRPTLRDLKRYPIARPPPRPRGAKSSMWLLLADAHFPFVDPATWSVVKQAARSIPFDGVVIMGDWLDFSAVDGHGKRAPETPEVQLLDEFQAGQRALDELDTVTGKAWFRRFLRGNHEWRMDRFLVSPACRQTTKSMFPSVADGLNLSERGYLYVAEKPETFGTDHLFIHGHFYSKHHAARHLEALWGNVVYGHTHMPQQFTHSAPLGVPRRQVGIATGLPTMRDLTRDWHEERRIHTWVNGFGIMEFSGDRSFARNIYVVDGKAAYGGHAWDASKLVGNNGPHDPRLQP